MSENDPFQTPPSVAPTANEMEQRNWALFAHLSALIGLVVPLGFVLGPLILWLIKKDQMPLVNEAGKEALNFQLTMLIGVVIAFVLMLVIIGVFLLAAIAVFDIVMVIIAAVQTSNGARYLYPLTIRFIH